MSQHPCPSFLPAVAELLEVARIGYGRFATAVMSEATLQRLLARVPARPQAHEPPRNLRGLNTVTMFLNAPRILVSSSQPECQLGKIVVTAKGLPRRVLELPQPAIARV